MNRFLEIAFRYLPWIIGAGLSASTALAWTPTQAPPWKDGTQTLHIGLDAQDKYVDGHTAASSFQEAIALWNNRIERFQMDSVLTTRTTAVRGDGVNHVVMASTIYGTEFGANVLAVATYFGTVQTRMETDIIFNSKWNWSSYRGSLQSGIPDLQRVAVHELGHFLGLGHPDEDGQRVSAIMNSSIGHTYQLTPDDRIGGAVLYGLRGSDEGLLPGRVYISARYGIPMKAYGEPVTLVALTSTLEPVGTLSYQWSKDGRAIPGANQRTHTIASATTADIGNYTVWVANEIGGSMSDGFSLMIDPPRAPEFSLRLEALTPGIISPTWSYPFHFELTMGIATYPITVTVKRDGIVVGEMNKKTNDFLPFRWSVSSANASHTGRYTFHLSNPAGTFLAEPIDVVVNVPFVPHLWVKSAGYAFLEGTTTHVLFPFEQSNLDLQFQWTRQGSVISEDRILRIPSFNRENQGDYLFTISNDAGSSQGKVMLTAISPAPPQIEVAPIGGSFQDIVQLQVIVSGQEPLTYEWKHNGRAVGSSRPFYNGGLTDPGAQNAGEYTVTVSNSRGSVTSDPVTWTFAPAPPPNSPPNVVELPARTTEVGTDVTHALNVAPESSEQYQWRKDGTAIPGANSATLILRNVQMSDSGIYTLWRSNRFGETETKGGRLKVIPATPPTIWAHPWLNTDPVSLSAHAESKSEITYKWYRNGHLLDTSSQSTLSLESFEDFSGVYTVSVSNAGGTTHSLPIEVTDRRKFSDIAIRTQPKSQTVTLGTSLSLNVVPVHGGGGFVWKKNGVETARTGVGLLPLQQVGIEDSGRYSVSFNNHLNRTITSAVADLRVLPYGRLFNLSSRSLSGGDNATLIAGFTVSGPIPKQVLIRGIGPALADFGVNNALEDPKLTLYNAAGEKIAEVDSLDLSKREEVEGFARRMGAFALDPYGKDAPLLITLEPGGYTAHLTAASGPTTGVALLEVYDCFKDASRLINLSTRTRVSPGSGTLISGFVVEPGAPKKVLVRAAGPALDAYGVADTLSDPELEIIAMTDPQQTVAKNDNWDSADATQVERAASSVGAFSFKRGSRDAAVVATLPPGAYTALVSGKNDTSGVALVEVYEIVD